jgi:hypothetical protein
VTELDTETSVDDTDICGGGIRRINCVMTVEGADEVSGVGAGVVSSVVVMEGAEKICVEGVSCVTADDDIGMESMVRLHLCLTPSEHLH